MGLLIRVYRGWRGSPQSASRGDGPAVAPMRVVSVLLSPFVIGVMSRMAIQILAFAQIMIAARYIDISGFGTYALGWASCVIFVSLVYTGFYQALLRSPDFDSERHTGFWSMAAIGAGGAVVMGAVGLILNGSDATMATVFPCAGPDPAAARTRRMERAASDP